MDLEEELEAGLEAACEAGKIMDNYRRTGIKDVKQKTTANDIVTNADIECQRKIVEILEEGFPDDGFRGEEEDLNDMTSDRIWVIDPIDGTTNFASGSRYFCTSIALKIDGETVLGIVHSPKTGLREAYYATKGGGAYIDDETGEREVSVSDRPHIHGGVFQVELAERDTERLQLDYRIIEELLSHETTIRRPGAAALDLCHVAKGAFDGCIDYAFEWDFAAGDLIVREAGGSTRLKEKAWNRKWEMVASNGNIQRKLESILERSTENS